MPNVSLAEERLNQAVNLLSTTTVVSIFYTLVFILYCLSFRLSYAQQLRDDHGKMKQKTVYTLVFQTVFLICATIDIIVKNRMAQVVYIDDNTLPGGPFGVPAQLTVANLSRLWSIMNLVENSLIFGVLLWRVWVIWSGTRFVIPVTIISAFLYLGNTGLAILDNAVTWNANSPTLAATPQTQAIISIMGLIFSIASPLFMTLTIIARLLFIRWRHIQLMGRSNVADEYFGIAAMLVESYALDALWVLGSLISFCLRYAPTANLFNNCGTQVDILTNSLVIYRVLSGRAWNKRTQDHLSTLRWGSNGASTTTSGMLDVGQTSAPEEDPPVVSFRNGV